MLSFFLPTQEFLFSLIRRTLPNYFIFQPPRKLFFNYVLLYKWKSSRLLTNRYFICQYYFHSQFRNFHFIWFVGLLLILASFLYFPSAQSNCLLHLCNHLPVSVFHSRTYLNQYFQVIYQLFLYFLFRMHVIVVFHSARVFARIVIPRFFH